MFKKLLTIFLVFLLLSQNVMANFDEGFWHLRKPTQQMAYAPSGNLSNAPAFYFPNASQLKPLKKSDPPLVANGLNQILPLLKTFSQITNIQGQSNDKVVVLIQDVHGLSGPQKSIGGLIEELMGRYPGLPVGMEGTAGRVETAPFRGPRADINRKIGEFFFKAGYLSGAEQAAFTSETAPVLFGVENVEAYLKNVDALQKALANQSDRMERIGPVMQSLEEKKKVAYSEKLKALDHVTKDFKRGELSLDKYISFLAFLDQHKAFQNFPNLKLFLNSARLEKNLDLDLAEKEQVAFFENIQQKVSSEILTNVKSASISLPVAIDHLARQANISLGRFPNYQAYLKYLTEVEQINAAVLFTELSDWSGLVWDSYFENDRQRVLAEMDVDLGRIENLVQLKLTSADWDSFRKRSDIIRRYGFDLDPFIAFYRRAKERDRYLVNGFLEQVNSYDARAPGVSVLVAGGFHASTIQSKLISEGFAVVTVTPKFDVKESDPKYNYFHLFSEPRSPLDHLFDAPEISLAPTSVLKPIHVSGMAAHKYVVSGAKALRQLYESRKSDQLVKGSIPTPNGESISVSISPRNSEEGKSGVVNEVVEGDRISMGPEEKPTLRSPNSLLYAALRNLSLIKGKYVPPFALAMLGIVGMLIESVAFFGLVHANVSSFWIWALPGGVAAAHWFLDGAFIWNFSRSRYVDKWEFIRENLNNLASVFLFRLPLMGYGLAYSINSDALLLFTFFIHNFIDLVQIFGIELQREFMRGAQTQIQVLLDIAVDDSPTSRILKTQLEPNGNFRLNDIFEGILLTLSVNKDFIDLNQAAPKEIVFSIEESPVNVVRRIPFLWQAIPFNERKSYGLNVRVLVDRDWFDLLVGANHDAKRFEKTRRLIEEVLNHRLTDLLKKKDSAIQFSVQVLGIAPLDRSGIVANYHPWTIYAGSANLLDTVFRKINESGVREDYRYWQKTVLDYLRLSYAVEASLFESDRSLDNLIRSAGSMLQMATRRGAIKLQNSLIGVIQQLDSNPGEFRMFFLSWYLKRMYKNHLQPAFDWQIIDYLKQSRQGRQKEKMLELMSAKEREMLADPDIHFDSDKLHLSRLWANNFFITWHDHFENIRRKVESDPALAPYYMKLTVVMDLGDDRHSLGSFYLPHDMGQLAENAAVRYFAIRIYNYLWTRGARGVALVVENEKKGEDFFSKVRAIFESKLASPLVIAPATQIAKNYFHQEQFLFVRSPQELLPIEDFDEIVVKDLLPPTQQSGNRLMVNIGQTNIKWAIVGEDEKTKKPKFIKEGDFVPTIYPTDQPGQVDRFMAQVKGIIRDSIVWANEHKVRLDGIHLLVATAVRGGGMAGLRVGLLSKLTGKNLSRVKNIERELWDTFNIPVVVNNDAVLPEELSNVAYLEFGTYLGAVVSDYRGQPLDNPLEISKVVTDMRRGSTVNFVTGARGTMAFLGSYSGIIRIALQRNLHLEFPELLDNINEIPRTLAGWLNEADTSRPELLNRYLAANKIFEEVGNWVASLALTIRNTFGISMTLLGGGILSGDVGKIVSEQANRILKSKAQVQMIANGSDVLRYALLLGGYHLDFRPELPILRKIKSLSKGLVYDSENKKWIIPSEINGQLIGLTQRLIQLKTFQGDLISHRDRRPGVVRDDVKWTVFDRLENPLSENGDRGPFRKVYSGRLEKDPGVTEYVRNKKILVTGAAGLVGSEVVRNLLDENPGEIVLSDVNEKRLAAVVQYFQSYVSEKNLPVQIKSRILDVGERGEVESAFYSEKPNVVFHLGADRVIREAQARPKSAVKSNTFGTINIVEASKEFGVERCVICSTSKGRRYYEDKGIYVMSKIFAEAAVQYLLRDYDGDTRFSVVRHHMTPENSDASAVFDRQAENSNAVSLYWPTELVRLPRSAQEAAMGILNAGVYAEPNPKIFSIAKKTPRISMLDVALNGIVKSGKTNKVPLIIVTPEEGHLTQEFRGHEKTEPVDHLEYSNFNILETFERPEKVKGGMLVYDPFYLDFHNFHDQLQRLRAVVEDPGVPDSDFKQMMQDEIRIFAFNRYGRASTKSLVEVLLRGMDPDLIQAKYIRIRYHKNILEIILSLLAERDSTEWNEILDLKIPRLARSLELIKNYLSKRTVDGVSRSILEKIDILESKILHSQSNESQELSESEGKLVASIGSLRLQDSERWYLAKILKLSRNIGDVSSQLRKYTWGLIDAMRLSGRLNRHPFSSFFERKLEVNRKTLTRLNNKTILIIGATGAIGQELAKAISQGKPKKLVLLSRTGAKNEELKKKIRSYRGRPELAFVSLDMADREKLKEVFENHEIDFVFHVGGQRLHRFAQANPLGAIKSNVMGLINLIEICLEKNINNIVYTSTEQAHYTVADRIYVQTKVLAESIVQYYMRKNPSLRIRVVRPFMVVDNSDAIERFQGAIRERGVARLFVPSDLERRAQNAQQSAASLINVLAFDDREAAVFSLARPVLILSMIDLVLYSLWKLENETRKAFLRMTPPEPGYKAQEFRGHGVDPNFEYKSEVDELGAFALEERFAGQSDWRSSQGGKLIDEGQGIYALRPLSNLPLPKGKSFSAMPKELIGFPMVPFDLLEFENGILNPIRAFVDKSEEVFGGFESNIKERLIRVGLSETQVQFVIQRLNSRYVADNEIIESIHSELNLEPNTLDYVRDTLAEIRREDQNVIDLLNKKTEEFSVLRYGRVHPAILVRMLRLGFDQNDLRKGVVRMGYHLQTISVILKALSNRDLKSLSQENQRWLNGFIKNVKNYFVLAEIIANSPASSQQNVFDDMVRTKDYEIFSGHQISDFENYQEYKEPIRKALYRLEPPMGQPNSFLYLLAKLKNWPQPILMGRLGYALEFLWYGSVASLLSHYYPMAISTLLIFGVLILHIESHQVLDGLGESGGVGQKSNNGRWARWLAMSPYLGLPWLAGSPILFGLGTIGAFLSHALFDEAQMGLDKNQMPRLRKGLLRSLDPSFNRKRIQDEPRNKRGSPVEPLPFPIIRPKGLLEIQNQKRFFEKAA